jgi:hypothetical protein
MPVRPRLVLPADDGSQRQLKHGSMHVSRQVLNRRIDDIQPIPLLTALRSLQLATARVGSLVEPSLPY